MSTPARATRSGFIAIVGRPNVGKSTLLNALLGTQISIVTPKAQTTRERVLGILTEGGGQIVFIDTPGIHKAKKGGINEYMMKEAKEALEEPSLIWYLVDPFSAMKHEQAVIDLLAGSKAPIFLLLNKSDLIRGAGRREPLMKLRAEIEGALQEKGLNLVKTMSISADTGKGAGELLEESWGYISEGPLFYPDEEMVSDRPLRFFVAEKIREQLLMKLGEELPYSCAVEIEKYQEPELPKGLTRIEAVIHVERDSQKGMVIGKAGHKIKEIGQAAREQIEEFIGGKAFLGLRVDVLKDWSKDAQALARMGYDLPQSRSSNARTAAPGSRRRGPRGASS